MAWLSICADHPGTWSAPAAARRSSSASGKGENFLASDANAIVAHTRQVVYLNDYDVATVTADRFDVMNLGSDTAKVQISQLEFERRRGRARRISRITCSRKSSSNPRTVENALRGRIDLRRAPPRKFGGLNHDRRRTARDRPHRHRRLRHELARGAGRRISDRGVRPHSGRSRVRQRIPLSQRAARARHRRCWSITQSGETADTLAALREAKRRGHPALAIVQRRRQHHRPRSRRRHLSARRAGNRRRLHQGLHFQVTVLSLLALLPGPHAACCRLAARAWKSSSLRSRCRTQIETILDQNEHVQQDRRRNTPRRDDFFFLGRHYNFPVALEGALKLKEISYIHAEGYPAAEMKHGPIALIDENTPSVFLVPQDSMYDKIMAQPRRDQGPQRPDHRHRHRRRRHTSTERRRRRDLTFPKRWSPSTPLSRRRAAATARLPHRRPPRLRRGQAPQPGQKRDGGMTTFQKVYRGGEKSWKLTATSAAQPKKAR